MSDLGGPVRSVHAWQVVTGLIAVACGVGALLGADHLLSEGADSGPLEALAAFLAIGVFAAGAVTASILGSAAAIGSRTSLLVALVVGFAAALVALWAGVHSVALGAMLYVVFTGAVILRRRPRRSRSA